jgi:anti-sigma B factor antagonist/stage II sporulation protein AA (anti-sigma F factor antagonist)
VTDATVTHARNGTERRVAIAGEIDLANAASVESAIFDAISNDDTEVVLDLTDVAYIDSSGVRILFALAARLRTLQVELVISAPPASPARRIIELSGMESLVALRPA